LAVPAPVTSPYCATGAALLLMLHLPFLSRGPIATKFTVTSTEPLMPAYAPVPLNSLVGPVPLNAKKQCVLSIVGVPLLGFLFSAVASTQKPPFWSTIFS